MNGVLTSLDSILMQVNVYTYSYKFISVASGLLIQLLLGSRPPWPTANGLGRSPAAD
jgi:hypothetical protein